MLPSRGKRGCRGRLSLQGNSLQGRCAILGMLPPCLSSPRGSATSAPLTKYSGWCNSRWNGVERQCQTIPSQPSHSATTNQTRLTK